MNNAKRKRIDVIIDKLEQIASEIDQLRDDEQESFDAMPEGLQGSRNGQKMEEIIESLQNASDACEDAKVHVQEAS